METEQRSSQQFHSRFTETSHANPAKMYGLIKSHKVGGNCIRVTTSGCGTAEENLSISVKKC